MPGIQTFNVPSLGLVTGKELTAFDTQLPGGSYPQQASVSIAQLAAYMSYFSSSSSLTTVAGTRYFVSLAVGAPISATGIAVLVGATGGTDKFIVELHDSTGALIATSALAGVTVGTAGTWQQIPFTAPVNLAAGTYFIAVQSNGTTARLATYNSPTSPMLTGSATGTFGTSAAITAPTTYTAAVGPIAVLY